MTPVIRNVGWPSNVSKTTERDRDQITWRPNKEPWYWDQLFERGGPDGRPGLTYRGDGDAARHLDPQTHCAWSMKWLLIVKDGGCDNDEADASDGPLTTGLADPATTGIINYLPPRQRV